LARLWTEPEDVHLTGSVSCICFRNQPKRFFLKKKKTTNFHQRKRKARCVGVRDENADEIGGARSGSAELAEDEDDEIVRQIIEEIWFLGERASSSWFFPRHGWFALGFSSFSSYSKRRLYLYLSSVCLSKRQRCKAEWLWLYMLEGIGIRASRHASNR
jgi:hypothetical protein